ncbi:MULTISPECIES: DUF2849 domain-containing protein [Roseibium]|uniref:DUF2849 domain-containing protein n=1 Tax=Roseibium polysiphoniae TaxID=2571221 RepID=A0ABR9CE48_9HYPH|nr:DUF2849 domain-containing protein [Roseibium polysiphoniae]MBD8878148.1 DUF2849 domain-containing protein [Roseibium polysiphoniae]
MKVVTANRLLDGEVVWQGADGAWVELLSLAHVLEGKDEVAKALELAAQSIADREVVEAYAMDVTQDEGRIVPVRLREMIRAAGPTTHPELGKQARVSAV